MKLFNAIIEQKTIIEVAIVADSIEEAEKWANKQENLKLIGSHDQFYSEEESDDVVKVVVEVKHPSEAPFKAETRCYTGNDEGVINKLDDIEVYEAFYDHYYTKKDDGFKTNDDFFDRSVILKKKYDKLRKRLKQGSSTNSVESPQNVWNRWTRWQKAWKI